jgi:hypothetical protein
MPNSWGWLPASGPADLVLAGLIISSWPASASWTLGLIVGVNLITPGLAIVRTAKEVRNVAKSLRQSAAWGNFPVGRSVVLLHLKPGFIEPQEIRCGSMRPMLLALGDGKRADVHLLAAGNPFAGLLYRKSVRLLFKKVCQIGI